VMIPCIDLQEGLAVQLVHGRKRELTVANVMGLLRTFKEYEWLHVIDLDAALGKGDNNKLVHELCKNATLSYGMKVRVGGGIRTVSRAATLSQWGAAQIIIGSAAFKDGKANIPFLRQLSRKVHRTAVVVALDSEKGRIVINGWRKRLTMRPEEVMKQLEPFCAGFLCTDVDREGTMVGANIEWFAKLRNATSHPIIAAGGIKSRQEINALQDMGMDAAVGMALYKKHPDLSLPRMSSGSR